MTHWIVTPMERLRLECHYYFGVDNLDNKFIDVLAPTKNEKVLFCLEYGEEAYNHAIKSAKRIYDDHNKLMKDIRTLKLKEEKTDKRNKHINKQKMNPYYQEEEWKK